MTPASLCPHCARPLPVSLLDPALYLAGDPGLDAPSRQFVGNVLMLVVRGLDLGPAHRDRLLALYGERHGANSKAYLDRWARIAADA